jgi:hypothetical protein
MQLLSDPVYTDHPRDSPVSSGIVGSPVSLTSRQLPDFGHILGSILAAGR